MDDTTGLTSGGGGGKRVMLPAWFVKHRRAGFAILINVCITILALACAVHAKKSNKNQQDGGTHESVGAYAFALIVSLITLPIEWAVDRRNPEMTKDLRFDLAGALIALAIIRLEATRQTGGYSIGAGTPCRGMYFETENTHFQVAIDVFFFISFLGAKLVGRTGSRELAMLVMADIVDFIELTFSMANFQISQEGVISCNIANKISGSTCNAIAAFTFIFALVTLLLQRAEGPGQKALNSLVQGLFVHIPLIAIRLAIPLSESNQTSFNLIFIVKNIVELVACIMDFLDAGSEVRNGGGSGDYDNLT